MISVERLDAKQDNHLSLNRERKEMGETELEEGETLPFHNGGNYVSGMNPLFDSNLIDKKIQDVLGHFQKDFEGIVSTENLGAIYGEYGSFLPTYRRSPMVPLVKNAPKGVDRGATKSSSNLNIMDRNRISVAHCNEGTSFRGSKAPPSCVEAGKSHLHMDTPSNLVQQCHSDKRLTAESSELKLLKLRIKMGSDNISTHKNAAIYSGLGLDDSPSLDGSEGEETSNEPRECSDSPARIVRIMTDFPAPGDLLMSPLADNLIKLTGEGTFCKDDPSLAVFGKRDRQSLGGKVKNGSLQKSEISFLRNSGGDGLNDDTDQDSLNCEDLITKTMKLPLLTASNASDEVKHIEVSSFSKDSLEASNAKLKTRKEEILLYKDERTVHKSKNANLKKSSTERVVNSANQIEDDLISAFKDDEGTGNIEKFRTLKQPDHLKRTGETNVHVSGSRTIRLPASNESIDGKKKKVSKKNRSIPDDATKGDGRTLKVRHDENQRPHTELKNAAPLYKEFFGEWDIGSEDCKLHAPAVSDNRKPKNVSSEDKTTWAEVNAKERSEVTMNPKASGYRTNEKATSKLASLVGPKPVKETVQPVPNNDNWVCCDKCQQWRLLPLDKNPDDLPENWLCSMLDWLPAMNSCRFTQDETTKALNALYHAPSVEPQNCIPNNEGAFPSGNNMECSRVPKNSRQDNPTSLPTGKKQSLAASTILLNGHLNEEVALMAIESDSRGIRCDNLPLEMSKKKAKDKYTMPKSANEKEDYKRDVARLKRSFENDSHKSSKKMRANGSVDNRVLTPNGTSEVRSKGILHTSTVGKHNELSSSKDSSYDINNEIKVCGKGLKVQQQNSSLDLSMAKKNSDSRDGVKKRKVDRFEDKSFENIALEKDDFSESERKIVKKTKISNSGGKEAYTGKVNGKVEKGSYKKMVSVSEEFESQQKNSVVAYPPFMANSSSSKVSCSHKSKINLYEAKGSPVESVSSSPLRTSKVMKIAYETPANFEKDVARDEHDGRRERFKSVKKENPREDRSSKDFPGSNGVSLANDSTNGGVDKQLDATVTSLKKINDDVKNNNKAISGKGAARSKDWNKISTSDSENAKEKAIDSVVGRQSDGGRKIEEQHKVRFCTSEDVEKKDSTKSLKSCSKEDVCIESGGHIGTSLTIDAIGSRESTSSPRKEPANNCSTSVRYQEQKLGNERQLNSFQETKKVSHCDGAQNSVMRNKAKDNDVSTSGKRDSVSQTASSVIKEAKLIKHTADRLKNDREFEESNKLYFEAALKFLQGCSMFESSTNETTKNADLGCSLEIYSSTAKLCEFCALEYERCKDMASAALAYKCMEVAYMRVVFHSHGSINRHELQTALQMVPLDVDNLNHTIDKPQPPKTAAVPQGGGNHVITPRMKLNFDRLLKISEDVYLAMEASRKARASFFAACSSQDPRIQENISHVRAAIDFNFQDMDALLRLVRVAFDSVTNSG